MPQAKENFNIITPVQETEQERQIIAAAKLGDHRQRFKRNPRLLSSQAPRMQFAFPIGA